MTVTTNGTTNGKTLLRGTVLKVHGNGIKLAGHDGWLNWSKWAKSPWMPDEGAHVQATVDGSGFIRELTPINEAPAPTEAADEPPTSTSARPADRDTQIARMNSITNAVAILTSGGTSIESVDDVLAVAAKLEAWITRTA